MNVIYSKLEASFLGQVDGRSTKELITLLKAIGEERLGIDTTLLSSRARFVRDHVQKAVAKEGGGLRIIGIIERYLAHVNGNVREFNQMRVEGADEWLLDRLTEGRGLVEVYLQSVQKLEEVKDIDRVVSKFNSDSDETLDIVDLVEQRLQIIRDKIVDTIVKFSTNQALSKLREQVSFIECIQILSSDSKHVYINQLFDAV